MTIIKTTSNNTTNAFLTSFIYNAFTYFCILTIYNILMVFQCNSTTSTNDDHFSVLLVLVLSFLY